MSISILMPVFNGARFLDAALTSVAGQLCADDELVVQDGGSTDGTIEILAGWQKRLPQLSLVSEPDHGQTDALQRALSRAAGDLVGWLNADDAVAPGALDMVRSAARDTPDVDVIYGGFQIVDTAGLVLRDLPAEDLDVGRLLRRGCYVFTGATYFDRATLTDVGLDTDLQYCMDFDLFLRLTARRGLRAARVSHALGVFRYHDESKSGTASFGFVKEAARIRRDTVARLDGLSLAQRAKYVVVPTAVQLLSGATSRLRYSARYSQVREQLRPVRR